MPCPHHNKTLCTECSGFDLYAPQVYNADKIKRLETENRRMRIALESMAQTCKDMLDPVRRAGP